MPGEPSGNDGGRQGTMNAQEEQDTQNRASSLALGSPIWAAGRSDVQQDALH
jgi:hypothetical protein